MQLDPKVLLPIVQPQFPSPTTAQVKASEDAVAAQEAAQAAREAEAVQVAAWVAYVAPAPPPAPTDYKAYVYNYESGNRPGAINPYSGACGLGQALPCSKMGCSLSDYACQDAFFTSYMLARYGSWYNAYLQEINFGWW